MVMPERLPMSLPSSPEGPALTASAAHVVAAAKAVSAEFTAVPKRRSFSAKYKLQILAETDRAVETGGISAILRREGLSSSALRGLARSARGRHSGCVATTRSRSRKGRSELIAGRTGQGQSGECRLAPPP
jgi:transposase